MCRPYLLPHSLQASLSDRKAEPFPPFHPQPKPEWKTRWREANALGWAGMAAAIAVILVSAIVMGERDSPVVAHTASVHLVR